MVYSTDGTTYSETIPTGTNVRSYTVYYKVDAGDTWNAVAAQTIDVTIDKATPVVTIPAASTLLYTGEAQPLITTASTTFGTLLYSTDGTTYSETIPTGTEVGTYTVYYKVEGSDNWNAVAPQSVTVEIKQGTAYVNAAGEQQPILYAIPVTNSTTTLGTDGKTTWYVVDNSVTFNQTVDINGNVNLILADGKELKVGSPDSGYGIYLTDNSSLTVYAQSHGDSKGILTVSGSTSIRVGDGSLTINGGQLSVTGFNDGVYNETGRMTVNNGYVNIITTNIGSSAINNMERFQRNGGTVILNGVDISKAIPTVTAPTPNSLFYSGSAQALVTAGTTSHGTMIYSTDGTTYSETIPTGTEIGTYTVYYKVDAGATWNAVAPQSVSVEIKLGTAYVNAAGEQQMVDAIPVTNSTAFLGTDGKTTWYVVDNSVTFNQMVYIEGNVNLILADGKELKVGIPDTDYGIYLTDNSSLTVYAQSHGDNKGILTVFGSTSIRVGDGSLTINGGQISVAGYNYGVSIGDAGLMTVKNGYVNITTTNMGSSATNNLERLQRTGGTVILNGNDISKAIPTVTAPTPNSLFYSGSAQALVTAGTTSHGTMVYSTDGTTYSETIPTGTNVRSYTVYYKVDAGDTWNAVAAQTIDVTIDKATPVVTIPAASTLLYTGEAQPLITTASTTFGTLLYSTDGTTYSETIPTGTEIDTYTVYYKVEGSDNWDEVEPQSVTVEIKLGTAYVNAAGETQPKVYAIPVTNSTDILGTDGKTMWYVVDNSVTLNQMVHIKGNVNLILTDGKELKVGIPDTDYGIYLTDNSSLTVYAQSHGDNKGKLTVSGSTSISVRNCSLTINGGQISVTGFNDGVYIYENGHMTVNNGYVNIITTNIGSSAINNLERLQRTGGTVMLNGNDISKAIPIVTAPTPKNLLYSGSAQALVTAGTTSHGTMVYSTDGTTYSETIPTATEAGTYIVFYKVDGGATWNAVPAQSFYVMIKPGTAYVNAAGEQQQRVDATPVTSSSADLGSAGQTTWYVVNNNITFDHSITISGDVNLILADGKELKVKSPNSDYGIYLDDNSSLTIYSQSHGESMGKLTATGGCGVSVRSGCLTINGGLINFRSETSFQSAVDIGNGGSMILNNGDVTAIGNGAQAINEPSKFYHNGGLLNGFNGTIVNESTTYLDATGASQSVTATVIQPGMQIGSPDEDTWYVAKGEVNFANGFSFIGHVNLILADGAKMTVNRSVSSLTSMTMGENKCLIIYSQSNGSSQGSLISDNIYISKSTANLTINGGNINVAGPENITGITVSDGSMTINGGQVTVTGGIIPGTNSRRPGVYFDNGTLTLGHNSTNDFILISSIENSNESLGTVNIKSGQHFVAEGGSTIVTGSGVDYAAVASQKLLPACAVTIADGITNGRVTADKSGVAIIADDKTVTLTVTPNEGYAIGSVKYNDGSDHAVEAVNGVYSFTAPAKDIAVTASFKKLLTNGITIGTIADQTCTGSEIKPAITVKDGMTDITGQCDFAFTDNTAVGTATVTITAKATSTAYAGEIATTFTIVREMSGLFADGNTWTGYVAQEDLTLPDGLTAYTVTALGKTTATAAALGYIPQGVPVLLSRTDKTANLYRASAGTGTEPTTNLLRVATTAKEVTVGECYVLYQDEFVLYGTGTLPAGTIYLPVGGTAGARRLSIGSGGDTTSMEDVRWQTEEGSGDWYSMDGRKLDGKPTKKGLYIHNGKKEVVK